jgi:hypothetical protein
MLDHPLDWTDARLQELRDVLSMTIYRTADIEVVLREGGLSPALVRWDLSPRALWFDIFNVAAEQLRLPAVVQAAAKDRPALARRVDELRADRPIVEAPWMPAEPVWLNIGNERQIVSEQNTLLDIAFLQHGLDRARAVCRLVVICGDDKWHGTGFRVGERTLLTNHHVLYGDAPVTSVVAEFGYEIGTDGELRTPAKISCNVATIIGEVQDDFAVIKTDEPLPKDIPVLSLRDGARPEVYDRVSIIQHPKGLPKKIAMHHNLVLHTDDNVTQYWTDTDYGSSGSPVFDEAWRVVALHHRWVEVDDGSGVAYRNQGRTISRVVERLDALGVSFED